MAQGLRKSILNWLILAMGVILIATVLVLITPSPSPARPSISWSPTSLIATLSPGETKTIPVSFVASKNVDNANVRVVPALQPYIETNPSTFGSLTKGQIVTLSLTISVPAMADFATFEGTIQMYSESRKGQGTVAKPLPVVVNIWPAFTTGGFRFSVSYPPNWTVTVPSLQQRGPVSFMAEFLSDPDALSGITVNVVETSLDKYLTSLDESLLEESREVRQFNGTQWVIINYVSRNSPRLFESAFAERNDLVYQITFQKGSPDDEVVFGQMLSTFSFSN